MMHLGGQHDLQNLVKIVPEPSQSLTSKLNTFRYRPERDFFNFLLIFGAPGSSQNQAKIIKNCKTTWTNPSFKSICFPTPFFLDFSPLWPPKINQKFLVKLFSRFYNHPVIVQIFQTSQIFLYYIFMRKINRAFIIHQFKRNSFLI